MNMKKKRIISLILVFLLVLGLTGCSGNQNEEKNNLNDVLHQTASILLTQTPEAGYGSVGGEWLVFGMARWDSGTPDDAWFEAYYDVVEGYVKDCKGVLDTRKYTEYSRVILALTAIGKDPSNVAGYNLLEPLADFDQTVFQGINGPAYALMALDSGNYEIPEVKGDGTQASRDMYIDYILDKEVEGGGWSLSGGPAEADLTAMMLQALAKYQDREDVQAAAERGVIALAALQGTDGSYTSYETDSCETISQVIVALCQLGIPMDDERFVVDGKTLTDRLLAYRTEEGTFRHTMDGEGDMMATEQAFYALVGLYQVQN